MLEARFRQHYEHLLQLALSPSSIPSPRFAAVAFIEPRIVYALRLCAVSGFEHMSIGL